ncbi:TetR/AcrR family transcriptional regulator [Kitasatospora sp. NPDC101183]|uniref:TetR/AcrR family transcriptional regulator n=1 Tax=Kitasatospora sp. NPDC101183 TaxID=3364100 RepID=UPI003823CB34
MGTKESGVTATGGARRPEKRRAITEAATRVFGREGFVRASMDAIAAEAAVSKRTVYNHFADKETLFLTVALQSAAELTLRLERLAAARLDAAGEEGAAVREALAAFAAERARALLASGEHGAVARAIRAEVVNIPADVLEAWLEAGPDAERRALAARFAVWARRGLLTADEPELVAERFTLLTYQGVAERSFWGALPVPEEAVERTVAAGVDAFWRLHGAEAVREVAAL